MKRILKVIKALITQRLVLTFDKVDFTYTHLSGKRLLNWFLAESSYALKSDRVWAYPTHLQVEPTNVCNLRCPLCHIVTDNKSGGFLSLENFKRLIDETGDYLLFLHFWGWGEPFLNKDFFSMIQYAKNKGIKIITSTNGHFFEEEENIDRLINSGLDALVFAVDGIDKETYETYQLLVRRKKERGVSLPLINLRMLVTRHNEQQVLQMRELAVKIGVDMLTLKTLCSFDNKTEGETLVPCNREYRRFEYDDKGKPIRKKNRCKKMWNHPTVYLDGTVVPCDYYTGHEFSIGNAFSFNGQGFRRVWFGKDYRQFRSRFLNGMCSDLRCGNCAMNFADVDRCVSHAFPTLKN